MRSLLVMVVVVAACGNDGKDGNQTQSDAPTGGSADAFVDPFHDAPATTTIQVTVSGKATGQTASGSTPLTGVTITAYRNADENTPLATTTSDGAGNYTITVQTNGESIDGFLKASRQGYLDTYLYPPYPLMMDFSNASIVMVSQATFDALGTLAQANQQPGKGVIGLVVTDGNAPVGSAMVTSNPQSLPVRYNALNGTLVLPSTTATSTYTDGVAYIFNVTPGQVTVSATHPSMTLASHGVKVRADVLTTTVIVP